MLDKQGLASEVSVGVTYSSLMSAVSLFFTGVLISQYKSFSPTIKVPLIYLIISTFSFIFAATIYSNAGAEITLNKLKVVEKYMIYAKNLMELLGLYLFILATPMVIGAVTNDSFLRTITIIVAISGFGMYSQSKFSVLDKELSLHEKRMLSGLIVGLTLLLYAAQTASYDDGHLFYNTVAIILLSVIALSAYGFSIKSKQYKPAYFRPYMDSDAPALSAIILKNLAKVKERNYPKAIIDAVREQSTETALQKLATDSQVFVSEFNGKLVGLISLSGNQISHVYTDPSLHRKGIGRMLVDYAETEASRQGERETEVMGSTLDRDFYVKLGYEVIREVGTSGSDKGYVMKKQLR